MLSPILTNILCFVNSGVFNSGESKNDLHFRVPPTPTGASLGGGPTGVLSPILPNIMYYFNSGVFNSEESKNHLQFPFSVTPTPTRVPSGGGLGA